MAIYSKIDHCCGAVIILAFTMVPANKTESRLQFCFENNKLFSRKSALRPWTKGPRALTVESMPAFKQWSELF